MAGDVTQEDTEEVVGTGFEHLDSVLEEMNEASVGYESFTLDHDDAGMLYDYIEELRQREHASEVMLAQVPDKALPLLKLIADSAEEFIFYFGDGDVFSDDAIQTYDILRDNVKRYKAEKEKRQA